MLIGNFNKTFYVRFISLFLAGIFCTPTIAKIYIGGSIGKSYLDWKIPNPPAQAPLAFSLSQPIVNPGELPLGSTSPINQTTTVSLSQDDNDISWKIFVGYQWNQYFGTEIEYINFGKAEASLRNDITLESGNPLFPSSSFSTEQKINLKTTGLALFGVLRYPNRTRFTPFAKLGMLRWEEEYSSEFSVISSTVFIPAFPASIKSKNNGTSLGAGLGLDYSISEKLFFGVEYEYFDDINDRNIKTIDASIKLLFGS